jgi:hypothetical protein
MLGGGEACCIVPHAGVRHAAGAAHSQPLLDLVEVQSSAVVVLEGPTLRLASRVGTFHMVYL